MIRLRPDRRPTGWLPALLAVSVAATITSCVQGQRGASTTGPGTAAGVEFGDADRGRELFVGYGCGACHQHGGVAVASGRVGPALDDLADQRVIAGMLPNTPEMLAAWIRSPQAYARGTGMPDLGVTEADAADIAAFLLETD
jgi:cytochrome c2